MVIAKYVIYYWKENNRNPVINPFCGTIIEIDYRNRLNGNNMLVIWILADT